MSTWHKARTRTLSIGSCVARWMSAAAISLSNTPSALRFQASASLAMAGPPPLHLENCELHSLDSCTSPQLTTSCGDVHEWSGLSGECAVCVWDTGNPNHQCRLRRRIAAGNCRVIRRSGWGASFSPPFSRAFKHADVVCKVDDETATERGCTLLWHPQLPVLCNSFHGISTGCCLGVKNNV